jgi:hypothetical protein
MKPRPALSGCPANRVRPTKRKARGYRSTTHLITMLYFVAGKLRLPQF